MHKRTNPQRRPKSEADVRKAKNEARDETMNTMMYMILWVFSDKHGANAEELQQIKDELYDVADSINRGYVKWEDLRDTLEEEYGVKPIRWV